ncbi:MAG: hypothetical protein K8R69_00525, partial [Deltaproteobacteria bacterium]|nr:hypothetical protein [Deltaproteobacteria bacterium]
AASRRTAEGTNGTMRNAEARSSVAPREAGSAARSFSAPPTGSREGQVPTRGEASLFTGGAAKSLGAGFSPEIFGARVLQGALGAATEAFLGQIFSGNPSAIPKEQIPVALQGLITALQGNPAPGTAVLQQGLLQISLNPALLNQLNPAQRQALQNLMAASGLAQTKLNNGAFLPLSFPSLTASRNLPGLMQRMEVSALKFASLLSADYLSKKRAEKSDEESAWLDKLGLFIRRKSSDKKDRKKLSKAARRFLEKVLRKQDAEWEDRKSDQAPNQESKF